MPAPTLAPALWAALTALRILPTADARAEAGHDLGLDDHLRGRVLVEVSPVVLAGEGCWFRINTAVETWFRSNRGNESPVRLSPEQIRYPVSGHLRFGIEGSPAWSWGLFAAHQSNHDVDVTDERLVVETVSHEIYGAELLEREGQDLHLWAGLVYDRGTTLAWHRQSWPFEHGIAGLHADGRLPLADWMDAGADVTAVVHRSAASQIPHLRLDAAVELSTPFPGAAGVVRPFLRLARVEDYQHLLDTPRTVALLGLSVEVRGPAPTPPRPVLQL